MEACRNSGQTVSEWCSENGVHWIRFVRLSCDISALLPVVEQAAAYLREAGIVKSRLWAYVLVEDVEDAHRRVLALERMGVLPPYRDYDGGEPANEQKAFARWVDVLPVHKSCTWETYYNSSLQIKSQE